MGLFTAIVPAQKIMTFAPAQAARVDNWSNQYAHLVEPDIYILPNQSGRIILLGGITTLTLKFEAPFQAAGVVAPIPNQICQLETYDRAEVGGTQGPFQPNPGVLFAGFDSPLHLHHVAGTHFHAHATTHVHPGVSSGLHAHTVAGTHAHNPHFHSHGGTHFHSLSIQVGGAIVTNVGFDAGGNFVAAAGPNPLVNTDSKSPGNTDNANVPANSPGNTDNNFIGATSAAAPGNTDPASSGDTDFENVQHTHP